MEGIYLFNDRRHSRNEEGDLIGIFDQDLCEIIVREEVKNNQYHRVLQKGLKYCTIRNGDTPLKALLTYGDIYAEAKYKLEDFKLIKISNMPGVYYPRIYRPFLVFGERTRYGDKREIEKLNQEVFQYPDYFPKNDKVFLAGLNQLSILKEMLLSILNNIYPASVNLKTYGPNIKNLLLLSCIEVETQLKGVYKANEISSKLQYTTRDYYKLKKILKLDKYEVRLPFYPELKSFKPFKNWKASNPTKSLVWYDNYNSIKHNSEFEFNKATLDSAISATCAVAILIKAQYGSNIPFWKEEIGSFFDVVNNSNWINKEKLLPPFTNQDWIESKMLI